MKDIIILFGEMGAGKNYCGERLAKDRGYTFFDGDSVALPEMIEKVSKFRPLTKDIIERYIIRLGDEIIARVERSSGLVVAQALYFDKHRQYLWSLLDIRGHNVKFYWVRTSFWRNLKQLLHRKHGIRWVLYWLFNKPFFQKPTHPYEHYR